MNTAARKLHIGCFDRVIPGWTNTDITPHLFVARLPGLPMVLHWAGLIPEQRYRQHAEGVFSAVRYLNVTRRFPYKDETFDCIYSSHLLEHLYPDDAVSSIRECRRVLRTGGVLRIAVPDLDRLVSAYDPRSAGLFLDAIFESRQRRDKNCHHWHYNQHSLRETLLSAGFREARQWGYRQGACADVEQIENRPESLFMEGVK